MIVDCPAHLLEGETGVFKKLVSEDMKRRSNLHTHMILANIYRLDDESMEIRNLESRGP